MAERVRFELTRAVKPCRFSSLGKRLEAKTNTIKHTDWLPSNKVIGAIRCRIVKPVAMKW